MMSSTWKRFIIPIIFLDMINYAIVMIIIYWFKNNNRSLSSLIKEAIEEFKYDIRTNFERGGWYSFGER